MAELRAALIGFGLAGSLFHGPLITAAPGITLKTVVTGNRAAPDKREPNIRGFASSRARSGFGSGR